MGFKVHKILKETYKLITVCGGRVIQTLCVGRGFDLVHLVWNTRTTGTESIRSNKRHLSVGHLLSFAAEPEVIVVDPMPIDTQYIRGNQTSHLSSI